MENFDLLGESVIQPLAQFNITHPFFNINIHTIVQTWIILGLIFLLLLPVSWLLKKKSSVAYYLITSFIDYFYTLCNQSLSSFSFNHFSFVTTLFIFIFSSNLFAAVPGIEEPTKDINTTLALGLLSFLYTQIYAVKNHGIVEYLKEYFSPFFLMFPLNVVGKVASVVSLSFRLFGNIFGGFIISQIYLNLIKGSLIGESLNLLGCIEITITFFFGIFEGFLQAFVFAMLTLTYLSIAIQQENPEPEAGETV